LNPAPHVGQRSPDAKYASIDIVRRQAPQRIASSPNDSRGQRATGWSSQAAWQSMQA
jgi:hypothetical protein